MTDLFNADVSTQNLFLDEPMKVKNEEVSIEPNRNESLIDRFNRCKAETNARLGVIEHGGSYSETISKQDVLNPNRKSKVRVSEDGNISLGKGVMNNTRDMVELVNAIREKTYKDLGITE